jgi:hypothetical protein
LFSRPTAFIWLGQNTWQQQQQRMHARAQTLLLLHYQSSSAGQAVFANLSMHGSTALCFTQQCRLLVAAETRLASQARPPDRQCGPQSGSGPAQDVQARYKKRVKEVCFDHASVTVLMQMHAQRTVL